MLSLTSILITLALVTPLFLFLASKINRSGFYKQKLPPSPPQLPIIGNLHQLANGDLPHRTLLSLAGKYGDPMFLQLGMAPTIVISTAKTAQEIFKNHDLAFSSRPPLYSVGEIVNNKDLAFSPFGDYWRDIRKLAVHELLTVKRVESFRNVREEEVALVISEIQKKIASQTPVNITSLAFNLSNTVVCRVAFNRRNDPEFEQVIRKIQNLVAEFNIADYFPKLKIINAINGVDKRIAKLKSALDSFLDMVISEHRNKSESEQDIVDVLLNIEKDPNKSLDISMDNIKGILTDIFVAGTDTSAITVVWTMTELIRHPQVLEKLQREVREIGAGKDLIEETDLPKLTYLKLVIKESLRLHVPGPLLVPRQTIETCTIGDKWVIPKGTHVIINGTALSMDPEYWEKPELFWPERFSDGKIDYKGQHFGYLPFGTGRRICPGMNFAMHIVELELANLVYRYDWELPGGMKIEDIDMDETLGFTVNKKVPLLLVAKPASL